MSQSDARATNTDGASTPPAVTVNPDVMGGWACFVGTRVPASMVVAMVDNGTPLTRLVENYPFLTDAHIAAARAYLAEAGKGGREAADWLGISGAAVTRRLFKPARPDPSSDPGT